MSDRLLHFNGIDGDTGDYLLRPRRVDQLDTLLKRGGLRPRGVARRLKRGVDALDLAAAGWGVIWGRAVGAEIREALSELLDHRRSQAARSREQRFRELEYSAGETPLDFLRRHGLGLDLVDPDKLPYYLLIVGDPGDVSFDFQFELGLQHAVGRLSLDTAADCAAYARQLIRAESGGPIEAPAATFFGVENPGDELTRLCVDELVKPLEKRIADCRPDWRIATLLRHAADKAGLVGILDGGAVPNVLFTVSHGLCFSPANQRQASCQGALLCADWPGRQAWRGRGAIPDEHILAARDIPSGADLNGLIAFNFACYSAGTPRLDPYSRKDPRVAADQPFVSGLPKRLLRQGALAVIGHVDVIFEQSFLWAGNSQLEVFESALGSIMAGEPVGFALDHFKERFALLSAHLLRTMSMPSQEAAGDLNRYQLWTAYNDARHFMMLGDPAARLSVAQQIPPGA